MPAFVLGPCCFYYYNAVIKLGISRGNPPALFLLLRIALAICDLWCFTVNFKIFFSISVKNVIDILIGITLNFHGIYKLLSRMIMLTILILSMNLGVLSIF